MTWARCRRCASGSPGSGAGGRRPPAAAAPGAGRGAPAPPGAAGAVARAATADPPAAILALDGIEGGLRARLDPFDLENGPPVLALATVSAGEEHVGPLVANRLRVLLERSALRVRQAELEAVLAAQAVTRRRDVESA